MNFFNITKKNLKIREILIFLLFAVVTLLVRFKTFNVRIVDWDETIYFMWGKDLLSGQLPYINILDDKPIGIALIYALGLLTFGKTMFSIRILSWLSVSCTSYLLYKTNNILTENNYFSGIIVGLIYSVYSALNGGMAANTEIFFLPFVVLSFYLLFSNKKSIVKKDFSAYKIAFLMGFFLGLAFLIKYVVLFDIISLFTIMFMITCYNKSDNGIKVHLGHTTKLVALIILGIILPEIVVVLIYMVKNKLEFFIEANRFIFAHATSVSFNINTMVTKSEPGISSYEILICSLPAIFLIKNISEETKKNFIYLFIWFFFVLFEVSFCLTHYWPHYFIQLLPSLCLMFGVFISQCQKKFNFKGLNELLFIFLIITFIFPLFVFKRNEYAFINLKNSGHNKFINGRFVPFYGDRQYFMANYIIKKIGYKKNILVLSEDYIIYSMAKAEHTSRFIMPFYLLDNTISSKINQKEEINKIMLHKPIYVLIPYKNGDQVAVWRFQTLDSNKIIYKQLFACLDKDYVLENRFYDTLFYRRKDSIKRQ